jgi:hypothetical protein
MISLETAIAVSIEMSVSDDNNSSIVIIMKVARVNTVAVIKMCLSAVTMHRRECCTKMNERNSEKMRNIVSIHT